jgi:hypothetical protein
VFQNTGSATLKRRKKEMKTGEKLSKRGRRFLFNRESISIKINQLNVDE